MEFRKETALIGITSLLALLLLGARCSVRTATDSTGDNPYRRSSGPWSVDGVRTGMTLAEVKALLGEPTKQLPGHAQQAYQWKEIWVTFNTKDLAIEIFGPTLSTLDRKSVLHSGMSESDVVQILGEGRMTKQYRPKGSGVITIGRELAGISHEYTDDNGRYTIWVYENQLRSVRVFPINTSTRK